MTQGRASHLILPYPVLSNHKDLFSKVSLASPSSFLLIMSLWPSQGLGSATGMVSLSKALPAPPPFVLCVSLAKSLTQILSRMGSPGS